MKNPDKPDNKIVYDKVITDESAEKLISLIAAHFRPAEILNQIRPDLSASYKVRVSQFAHLISPSDPIESILQLPLLKMNEEERLLHAYLCKANLLSDLPSFLLYFHTLLHQLGDPSYKRTVEDLLEIAVTNFYASKIRLYSEDASETDDDFYQKIEEENKNRKPLSKEEAEKEIAELQSFPLFMTELPEHPEKNEKLLEIQSLQYSGKDDEVCRELMDNCAESLDSYKKSKKFNDLRDAMNHICNAIEHGYSSAECDHIKFEMYKQRAEMQILVKNWRYAIEDIEDALKFKAHIKDMNLIDEAYLMLVNTYINLEQYSKAKEIIEVRLNSKENVNKDEYNKLKAKLTSLKEKIINDLSKQEAFKNMENDKKLTLYNELSNKGIKLEKQLVNIPVNCVASIYRDDNDIYHFPILIVYDEFNMTDYIRDFEETSMMSELLETIYQEGKLPWDKDNKYNINNTKMFYKCSKINEITKYEENFYFPIRKDETLLSILTNKRVVMNGFPIICLVSTMSYNFYQHFLSKNIILKRKFK